MEEDNVKSVTSIGNSWIICRSQSHGGRVYYFNTFTGNAVWNLSDAEMKKAQLHTMSIEDSGGTNIQKCPEPTEPPVDVPLCTSQPPPRGAKIYNKQIINNQFSKPYTVPPFVSQQCHCGSINHMCDGKMNVVPTPVFNPNMWTVPPPHPLYLTPAMHALPDNHFHTIHQPPPNVGLPTAFQVRNNFPNKSPYHLQGAHRNTPQYQNCKARMNPRFSRNFENKPNKDLRNVLSARRKIVMDANSDARQQETSNDNEKVQDVASIGENDLYPSDIDDDWLEANAVEDKSKLTLSVSSLQKLASDTENHERWFIVVSAIVLLNHLKLLNSLANSDEQVHVVAPMEVRRALRSATGGAGALGRRARRANKWAAQQANKVPADLESCTDGSLAKCCLDLVRKQYYVVHLTDDSDLQKNQIEIHNIGDSVPIFTMSELKEYLVQNTAAVAPRANITVTVFPEDDEGKQESLPEGPATPALKEEDTNIPNTDSLEPQPPKTNETEQNSSPKKRTANASVQTDFYFPTQTQCSSSLNSTTEVMEIDHTFKIVNLMESDSSKEEATSAKKIKLNRNQAVKKDESVKKPSFKWRKRRAPTNSSLSENLETNKQETSPVFPPLATQPDDDAVDCEKSLEIPKEITQEENDIVMFKVTGDQMDDYLSKGSDEWLSRFVQIMEEALTQILHQEPCFLDGSIPPPWSIQEATVCIKHKFKHNSNIVFASYTLNNILEELSDSRGKIYPNLDPARFMEMYSYGVNLIEALQSEVKDNEDIQIALDSLSKLLFDIRNPNAEGTHVFPDSFVYEDAPSANVTESEKYDEPDDVPTSPGKTKESTPKETAQESVEKVSPRKYSLRSAEKAKPECVKRTDKESSFFTGLGLKKNIFVDGAAIKVSFNNSQNTAPGREDEPPCEQPKTQPRITRNFAKCPEFEEKLKQKFSQFDQDEFAEDKNCSGNDFYLEEDYDGSCGKEEIKRSPSFGDFDTSAVFNWFVERTICPINKVLKNIHTFCLDANEDLQNKESMEQDRKMNLSEKTAKLSIHLGGLCKNLNSILQRKDTRSKFREMMQVLEINDFVLTNSQESNYKTIIEKLLEQAGILLHSVNLIAAEVMDS